jgi:predicted NACHT family NTPase
MIVITMDRKMNEKPITNEMSTSVTTQDDLSSAMLRYNEGVVVAYNSLQMQGFEYTDPNLDRISLQDIFVRLRLFATPQRQSSGREKDEMLSEEPAKNRQPSTDLAEALRNNLLIMGNPGSGKSTLLRWLAITFATGRQRQIDRLGPLADAERLPLLIELGKLPDRYLRQGEIPSWLHLLPEYLPQTQPSLHDTPPALISTALSDGRCLVLFDGLDEVADLQLRSRIVTSILNFHKIASTNRIVVGSRPAGVTGHELELRNQGFHVYEIEGFNTQDVRRFVEYWLKLDDDLSEAQRSDEIERIIRSLSANETISHLASNPLLTYLLVQVARKDRSGLPEGRAQLYQLCCEQMILRWRQRLIAQPGTAPKAREFAKLPPDSYLEMLAPVAYAMHRSAQSNSISGKNGSQSYQDILSLLTVTLKRLGPQLGDKDAENQAPDYLRALVEQSGLLQRTEQEGLRFPHLTFGEYLAARYIAAMTPEQTMIDEVMGHIHDSRWREVIILAIGHLSGRKETGPLAGRLLKTIIESQPVPKRLPLSVRFTQFSVKKVDTDLVVYSILIIVVVVGLFVGAIIGLGIGSVTIWIPIAPWVVVGVLQLLVAFAALLGLLLGIGLIYVLQLPNWPLDKIRKHYA